MDDIRFKFLILISLCYYFIEKLYIFPKIREHKKLTMRDWMFRGPHQISNLFYYKKICSEENIPPIWFYVSICLVTMFVLTLVSLVTS